MLNKAMIIGNLGSAPEIRHTNDGTMVATFSVATSERWKGKDGTNQEHTEWHRVVAWGKLASICGEYLSKGSKIYIEGKLKTRKWQDSDGNDRYSTEIIAREMKMLDSNGGTTTSGSGPLPQDNTGMGEDVPF